MNKHKRTKEVGWYGRERERKTTTLHGGMKTWDEAGQFFFLNIIAICYPPG